MMWRTIILINILLGFHVTFCDIVDKTGLKAVVVLYRHGDRSPIFSYPKDPYFDKQYWPMGFGQLLNKGKQRQYNLGKWLRDSYKEFLPEKYSPNDIYVYSTDLDRALMSAAANLAGLYPPLDSEAWEDGMHWQPIPVHSASVTKNPILQAENGCPKHTKLLVELERSEFFQSVNKRYSNLYDQISYYTGWNVNDTNYLGALFSVIDVYSNHNASFIPKWFSALDMSVVEFLAALNFIKFTCTTELAKLRNGVFFYKILEHFDYVIKKNEDTLKLLMYSAHDATLAWILDGLSLFDYRVPNFAAMIIWELYNKDDKFYINILYKYNDTYVEKLILDGCNFDCDYSLFRKIVEPLLLHPDERDIACAVEN